MLRCPTCEMMRYIEDKGCTDPVCPEFEILSRIIKYSKIRKENNMGKVKTAAQDFLEEGGCALGYSPSFMPSLEDFAYVLSHNIDAQSYAKSRESNDK